MAPKRNAAGEPPDASPAKRVTRSASKVPQRVTRSSGLGPSPAGSSEKKKGKRVAAGRRRNAPEPRKKKAKVEKKEEEEEEEADDAEPRKKKAKVKEEEEEEEEADDAEPKKKKAKVEKKEEEAAAASSSNPGKIIVIERCDHGQVFKIRAAEVIEGLKEKAPDVTVKVNPTKPRKGCFEVREEGGGKIISVLRVKRPFKRMKDLDIDKVIADIVDKINGQCPMDAQDNVDEQGPMEQDNVDGQGPMEVDNVDGLKSLTINP